MDDVFIYCVDLPPNIHEMVVPCADGYTVYLDIKDSTYERFAAYRHAMEHIKSADWQKIDVNQIEFSAHYKESRP